MAYDYSGTSQTHEQSSSSPVSAYPFTVACWVQPDGSPGTPQNIWATFDGLGLDAISIALNASDNAYIVVTTDGGVSTAIATSTGTYNAAAWNSVVGYCAGDTSRGISLNGATFDTNADSYAFPTNAGAEEEVAGILTTNNELNGKIAEIAVWGVQLTQVEADMFADGFSPLFIRPQSLLMYRPMIRNTNDIIRGNSYTANGTPTVSPHCRIILPNNLAFSLATAAAPPGGGFKGLTLLGVGT